MKHTVAGALAVGAALLGAGAAGADSGWVFTPDPAGTTLVQSPDRSQLAWDVPGKFTNGDEALRGELFIRPTGGGQYQPDFQFDSPGYRGADADVDSSVYAYGSPAGSGYGVPAYFYSPGGLHDLTGSAGHLLTGGNGIALNSSMSWLLAPADYSHALTFTDAVEKVPVTDVFALGPAGPGDWTPEYGTVTPVLYQNLPMWSSAATFTQGDETMTGTLYLNSIPTGLGMYNAEFVTADGALYSYSQGWLGFDNMVYRPGDGGALVDVLKTPFGNWDVSSLWWLFPAPDYSTTSATDASAVLSTMLVDPALSDTIAFGQSVADASDSSSGAADTLATALGSL